jgi:hypothetical protein
MAVDGGNLGVGGREEALEQMRDERRWLRAGKERGGKTQLIWDFCAYWRNDGFFDNLIGC